MHPYCASIRDLKLRFRRVYLLFKSRQNTVDRPDNGNIIETDSRQRKGKKVCSWHLNLATYDRNIVDKNVSFKKRSATCLVGIVAHAIWNKCMGVHQYEKYCTPMPLCNPCKNICNTCTTFILESRPLSHAYFCNKVRFWNFPGEKKLNHNSNIAFFLQNYDTSDVVNKILYNV